jgi:hypothetical protein
MAKSIDAQSIFGEYEAKENRLTVALLQILKIGGEPLIRYFAEGVGFGLPSSEIGISTQVGGENSVLDGLLESDFRFRLLIESKIKPNSVNARQLKAHLSHRKAQGENSILLYLTPDARRPPALTDESVAWANWVRVRDILNDYRQKSDVDQADVLNFLVDQFERFAGNLQILEPWQLDSEAQPRVLVVPARDARGTALRHQVYLCQNRRTFKPSRWIAFYAFGQIDTLAEIDGPPEDDVEMTKRNDLMELAKTQPEPETPRRLIRLKNVEQIGPITNDVRNQTGKAGAWVQGQRYTTIDKIRKARFTSEL